jgi:hypothetical protein
MPRKASTPEFVIAAVLAAFIGAGIAVNSASHGSSGDPATAGARAAAARVAPIARRVEKIRGLRFRRLPKPQIVTGAQTRATDLREYDRFIPAERRRATEQVLQLLGLLEPGTNLREVEGTVTSEQVAGYYDQHRKRLAIVAGSGAADNVTSEITLAHELDHALDDQRIGLRNLASTGADDAGGAYTALVEGVATSVMDDYAKHYIDPGAALGSVFASGGSAAAGTDKIPRYILESILFSYIAGEKYVNRLREVGHGWKLVNYAMSKRPPRSTEQVIHPEKYFLDERPVSVAPRGLDGLTPAGWRQRAHGTLGEFDTYQLLKLGADDTIASDAAAGWGGGAYALWGPSGSPTCRAPCRTQSALVLTWAWDSELDAQHFDEALRPYLRKGLHGRAAGAGVWAVGDGFAATATAGPRRSSLAFAPSARMAARLASGALGR